MKVLVPATTANLGPGFDLLGATLDLENEVEAVFSEEYSLLEEGYTDNKPFRENLIARIMVDFLEAQGVKKPFKLTAVNKIPYARGMGSSSAAIVGALVLANELCGNPLTKDQLLQQAISLEDHPDNVAPALLGGVILSSKTAFLRLPAPHIASYVLIPDFTVSTKAARGVLPNNISRDTAVANSGLLAQLVVALERGDSDMFLEALDDSIHEPYRGTLIPGFTELRNKAAKLGGKLIISGSGPTLLYLKNSSVTEAGSDAQDLSRLWFEKFQLQNQVLAVSLGINKTKVLETT